MHVVGGRWRHARPLQFNNQILQQPFASAVEPVKFNSHSGFARSSHRAGQPQPHRRGIDHDFKIAGAGERAFNLNVTAGFTQVAQLAFRLPVEGMRLTSTRPSQPKRLLRRRSLPSPLGIEPVLFPISKQLSLGA